MVVSKNFVDLQNKCLVFQLTIFVKSVCDLVKNYSRIILLELHEKISQELYYFCSGCAPTSVHTKCWC